MNEHVLHFLIVFDKLFLSVRVGFLTLKSLIIQFPLRFSFMMRFLAEVTMLNW